MKLLLAVVVLILIAVIPTAIIMMPSGLAINYSSQIRWGAQPMGCDRSTIYVTSLEDTTGPSCWGLFLPSTEGGNTTSELNFINRNSNRFKVVVLDDYAYEDAVVKNLTSQNITPIPVLYPYELMNLSGVQRVNPTTKYTILAISPYDMILFKLQEVHCYTSSCLAATNASLPLWESMISSYSKLVVAKSHLILLEYTAEPSFWKYPIPQNYTIAMQDEARMQNVAMIMWS